MLNYGNVDDVNILEVLFFSKQMWFSNINAYKNLLLPADEELACIWKPRILIIVINGFL